GWLAFLRLGIWKMDSKGGSWQGPGGALQPPWLFRRKANPPFPTKPGKPRKIKGFGLFVYLRQSWQKTAVFPYFCQKLAHSTAAGENNPSAAVLCVFVHKNLSVVFEGNRLFMGGIVCLCGPFCATQLAKERQNKTVVCSLYVQAPRHS
ncbi:MAG: hypothetical protein J5789_04270, partial [Oscillospiraceae bacterium]|nr:hypothetical protein [Oscillospiraceae bacterium]